MSSVVQNRMCKCCSVQFGSVQSLSHVWLFATPWITACQASLSIINSRSLLKLMPIELVMPSSHLILCHPLLLQPPIPPSIRVFSNESALRMRWPKYWSFSFIITPSNEHPGLISFRMDWMDLLQSKGLSKVFSNTTVQKHQFFSAQLSLQSNYHIQEELYKKDLHDSNNHNGVITHLEPDILECDVKWALGSITTNKASGGDGIPVELFQSLKDDAVKVLHSICQQIWKTQQWPQDWKRSVFIPVPKKGNPKDCSNYCTIALISHASKVMLKILQARLQQYVNHELPDVQAGFRKGRGTEIKLPISTGSS